MPRTSRLRIETTTGLHPDLPGTTHRLGEAEFLIGRAPDNDLVIPEKTVSRHHASIVWDPAGEGHVLADEGSSTGTLLGGERIQREPLTDGDVIEIGPLVLRYEVVEIEEELAIVEDPGSSRPGVIVPPSAAEESQSRHLSLLARLARTVGAHEDGTALREGVLELVFSSLDVDRVVLAMRDAEGRLGVEARRSRRRPRGQEDIVKLTGTVVGMVMDEGKTVLTQDAAGDLGTASIGEFGIGSILCAPLCIGGRPVGLIYADTIGRRLELTRDDENFFVSLAGVIASTLSASRAIDDLQSARQQLVGDLARSGQHLMLGESPALQRTLSIAERYARTPDQLAPVLITGERGTGKSRLARFLHERSPRSAGPLLQVDCGSIVESLAESILFGHAKGAFTGADANRDGHFQAASGGTLFLDEVGELSPALQAKLLVALRDRQVTRVGETKPQQVDVRIVAATNRDLRSMAADGSFRADLLDRLQVLPIAMPPLRERREDIPTLARYFLAVHGGETSDRAELAPAAEAALQACPWDGNVAELENIMRRLIAMTGGTTISAQDLPDEMRQVAPLPEAGLRSLADVERDHIAHVLRRTGGNKSRAAEILGIYRGTLAEKVKKYGLE